MNKIILPTFFVKNKIFNRQVENNCIIYSYTVDTDSKGTLQQIIKYKNENKELIN